MLAATLSAGHVPVASVALVLGIHRLMSQGLTPTNLVGNAVATIVIAKWKTRSTNSSFTVPWTTERSTRSRVLGAARL